MNPDLAEREGLRALHASLLRLHGAHVARRLRTRKRVVFLTESLLSWFSLVDADEATLPAFHAFARAVGCTGRLLVLSKLLQKFAGLRDPASSEARLVVQTAVDRHVMQLLT